MAPPFSRSVFVNAPFDPDYAPLLQAICFCTVYLGFHPRLAPENPDNAAARLDRIADLISRSQYGIHDLSRCRAEVCDEFFRLNMPFELGMDHACRRYGSTRKRQKAILVLEHNRYDYQRALSDISGWDIRAHQGDHLRAVRHVRSWLIAQAGAPSEGASRIQGKYAAFQEWYWEREMEAGSSEEDIKEYPTSEVINAMHAWMKAGQPDTYGLW